MHLLMKLGAFATLAKNVSPLYGRLAPRAAAPRVDAPPPLEDLFTGDVGLSFTAGGLCFPYQLGAAKTLYEANVMRPSRPISGASSGGIIAVIASLSESGAPSLDECFESALRVNSYCRDRAPSARGLLYDAVFLEAERLLDESSVARINERAAPVTVAVTRFTPLPTPTFISQFNDLADLRQAVLATSCIPFYFAKAPCIFYRGVPAVDGFFAVPRKYFGAPETSAARTIRICPFPKAAVGLASEDVIAPADADLGALFACALGDPPATDGDLRALYARGQRDAREFVERAG
mmetsp:Transcript_7004/g.20556  ORF Transcript_7004/g.20556 Transcript_7004/m.20556 type:complete len:293 (+) Transcript_7004:189-1067(+)